MRVKKDEFKERITVTIDKDLLEWIDQKVSEKIFASRSHGFEFLVKQKQNSEVEKWENHLWFC